MAIHFVYIFFFFKKSAAEMEIFSIDAGLALKNKSQVLVILVFETLKFIGAEGLLPLC